MKINLIESFAHLFHPRRSNRHRSRILHLKPLVILSLLVLMIVGGFRVLELKMGSIWFDSDSRILGYASNITVSQVVSRTNKQRQQYGLPDLKYNDQLSQAAGAKAEDMFAHQYWSHTSPSGLEPWDFIKTADYSYRVAGENLARDFSTTSEMVQAWMDSPTHRANMLHKQYQEIGVAVTNGTLQGIETTLVVQMFGSPPVATSLVSGEAVTIKLDKDTVKAKDEDQAGAGVKPSVLSEITVPVGGVSATKYRYQPLDITKSIVLSLIILLMLALLYDWYAIGHRQSVRMVGKNLAHLALLGAVVAMILLYQAGQIL